MKSAPTAISQGTKKVLYIASIAGMRFTRRKQKSPPQKGSDDPGQRVGRSGLKGSTAFHEIGLDKSIYTMYIYRPSRKYTILFRFGITEPVRCKSLHSIPVFSNRNSCSHSIPKLSINPLAFISASESLLLLLLLSLHSIRRILLT